MNSSALNPPLAMGLDGPTSPDVLYPSGADSPLATEEPAANVTVLVVDDHDSVRQMAVLMLQTWGFRVLQANGGPDALRVITSFPGRIDLLLTDVLMPGMSGPDLARRVRQQRPDMKVLFMSGYVGEEFQGEDASIPFLAKPYSIQQLDAKVREALAVPA